MKKRQRKKKRSYKGIKGKLQAENIRLSVMQLASQVQIFMLTKQIEMIQAQRIPSGNFKTGGMASGITRINEAGGEIVNLPDGSRIIPEDIEKQIVSSGEKINIVISNKQ